MNQRDKINTLEVGQTEIIRVLKKQSQKLARSRVYSERKKGKDFTIREVGAGLEITRVL